MCMSAWASAGPLPLIIMAPAIIRPALATLIIITMAGIAAIRSMKTRSYWAASPWAARIIIAGMTAGLTSGIAAAGKSRRAGTARISPGTAAKAFAGAMAIGTAA